MADDSLDQMLKGIPLPEGEKKAMSVAYQAAALNEKGQKAAAAEEGKVREQYSEKRDAITAEAKEPGGALAPFEDRPYRAPPPTDPWALWGSPTMWLAGMSGLVGRRSFGRSLDAAAGVMDATNKKDAAAEQHAFEVWKHETENAFRAHEWERDLYKDSLDGVERNEADALAKVKTIAIMNGNKALEEAAAQGPKAFMEAYKIGQENHRAAMANSLRVEEMHLSHRAEFLEQKLASAKTPEAKAAVQSEIDTHIKDTEAMDRAKYASHVPGKYQLAEREFDRVMKETGGDLNKAVEVYQEIVRGKPQSEIAIQQENADTKRDKAKGDLDAKRESLDLAYQKLTDQEKQSAAGREIQNQKVDIQRQKLKLDGEKELATEEDKAHGREIQEKRVTSRSEIDAKKNAHLIDQLDYLGTNLDKMEKIATDHFGVVGIPGRIRRYKEALTGAFGSTDLPATEEKDLEKIIGAPLREVLGKGSRSVEDMRRIDDLLQQTQHGSQGGLLVAIKNIRDTIAHRRAELGGGSGTATAAQAGGKKIKFDEWK